MTVKRIVRPPVRQATRVAPRPSAVYVSTPPAPKVRLHICKRGWVYAGSLKIGRYVPERRTVRMKIPRADLVKRMKSKFLEIDIDEFSRLNLRYYEAQVTIDK